MTENEIALDRPVDLDFQPAQLDFTNFEELKAVVQKYADGYRNFVFTKETKTSAVKARTELLSIVNAIDDNRKNVKRVYNKPLNDFETQIKELTDAINEPLNQIRAGLKEIDDNEKELRQDALNAYLSELIKNESIGLDDIETDPKWLNKGNWNDKYKPTTKLKAELERAVDQSIKAKEKRDTDLRILTEFCKAKDIDPAGWVSQLDFKSVTEVMDLINIDEERKAKAAKQQEEKAKEFETKQSEQRETFKEAQKVEETDIPEEPVTSDVIRVTGTVAQLNALNDWLVDSGIQVEAVQLDSGLPF